MPKLCRVEGRLKSRQLCGHAAGRHQLPQPITQRAQGCWPVRASHGGGVTYGEPAGQHSLHSGHLPRHGRRDALQVVQGPLRLFAHLQHKGMEHHLEQLLHSARRRSLLLHCCVCVTSDQVYGAIGHSSESRSKQGRPSAPRQNGQLSRPGPLLSLVRSQLNWAKLGLRHR